MAQSMVIDSVHVTSFTYDCFPNNTTYKFILRINIVTSNASNPLTLSDLTFNTSGSTNASTDIKNARVFSTGNADVFSKNVLFGSNANPTGSFVVSGSDLLNTGDNYFWLTYDITDAATPGNIIQAVLDQSTISTVNYPSTGSSIGFNRTIDVRSNYPHKEANVWYTDKNLGIDFNCTTPVIIDDHSDDFISIEGTGAICDEFGNLLFYTDAERVFNRVHEIIPNGNGMLSSSSKHSGLFIKKPLDSTTYYLISPGFSFMDELYWNEIDLTLDGGFGDIVPGMKNLTLMNNNLDEMVTCVNHCNGQDVWVLTGKNGTNEFHAFLVSDAGLSTVPVVSTPVGGPINTTTGRGTIKFSPNGKWLVLAAQISTSTIPTTLYQFDNSTGIVSNPLALDSNDAHAISFSPDNTKLYIGHQQNGCKMYQYELDIPGILASRTLVGNVPGPALWLLQNAPDGKIYMDPGGNATTYPVINNPNLKAPLCNFDPTGFSLNGRIHSFSLSFISCYNESFFNLPTTLDTTICNGDSIFLGGNYQTTAGIYYDTLTSGSLCDSIVSTNLIVSPLDSATITTSICEGDSILLEGNYQTTTGVYYDTLTVGSGCDSILIINLIVSTPDSTIIDASICEGDSLLLQGNYQTTTGTYYDTLTSGSGCDSILITNLIAIQPDSTIIDISICAGDSLLLQGEYQANTGVFYDTLTSGSGCDSILITNLIVNLPDTTTIDTSICEGDSLLLQGDYQTSTGTYLDILTAASGCDSILITNLIIDPSDTSIIDTNICEGDSILLQGIYQASTGTYFDILTAGSGCDSILITNLIIDPLDFLQVTSDTSIMLGASLELLAVGSNNYLWSTGDTGNSITISPSQTTTYSVTSTSSQGCETTRTITITVTIQYSAYVPNIFSPSSNQEEHQRLYVYGSNIETYELVIYDRWGEVVFETSDLAATIRQDGLCCRYGPGWDGNYKNKEKLLTINVFAYKLTGAFANGEAFFDSGNITMVK